MLRIDQLRLLPGEPEAALLSKCATLLRAVSHDLRTPLTSIYGACSYRKEYESQL